MSEKQTNSITSNTAANKFLDYDNATPVSRPDRTAENATHLRAAYNGNRGKGRRLAKATLEFATAAAVVTNPAVQDVAGEIASTLNETVAEATDHFGDIREPEAGNPANTEEIISTWSDNPAETVITVEGEARSSDLRDSTPSIYETGVSEATEPYRVEPGDNAWNMGVRVEANVDGIAGNQDVRPFVDDIQAQAGEDGVFQVGDTVQLPAGSDRHQDPGVQLSSK